MTKNEHTRPAAGAGKRRAPELDRDIQMRIGESLRAMYDDIVQQGVPDRFADLLSKLDEKGRADKDSPGK